MAQLALLGGEKIREKPFPKYPLVNDEIREAVKAVLDRGEFSTFIADKGEAFLGGKEIRKFEEEFAAYHKVKYAISFNSATSALHAAVVAAGAGAGDEIITSPFTFTSSATCALMNNAVPLFADIDRKTYCISRESIEKLITPRTKAIMTVQIFGQCADMDPILTLAKTHKLMVIEDVAQAPGALYKGRLAGTIGDCGIFSLQESKHIPAGEGGVLITNSDNIAQTARLVRNHGEVIGEGPRKYRAETLGWNYRLVEFSAAMARVGLKKLDQEIAVRQKLAQYLTSKINGMPGLVTPFIPPANTHVYYVYPIYFLEQDFGISRDLFVKAVQAEGIPLYAGYVNPLYLSPLYQEKEHFAFKLHEGPLDYRKGLCPVVEEVHAHFVEFAAVLSPATQADMDDVAKAMEKVYSRRAELVKYNNQ